MAQPTPRYQTWLNMLVLISFGWAAILIELAPLDGLASALPSPDILFCVAACLVLRRPAATPAMIVSVLGIARDLMGGGPAGLGALVLLATIEVLRFYGPTIIRRGLVAEIFAIAALSAIMAAVQVVMLTITLTPTPPLDQLGTGVAMTIAAYLLTLLIFRVILRVRAEADEGTKLSGRIVR